MSRYLRRQLSLVQDVLYHILARLPFPACEIHSDHDSAFLNRYLLRFWCEVASQALLSHSRPCPYPKNGNRFVAQRNGFLVCAYLSYDCLNAVAQTLWLNRIEDQLWLYHNFHLLVRRL